MASAVSAANPLFWRFGGGSGVRAGTCPSIGAGRRTIGQTSAWGAALEAAPPHTFMFSSPWKGLSGWSGTTVGVSCICTASPTLVIGWSTPVTWLSSAGTGGGGRSLGVALERSGSGGATGSEKGVSLER